MVPPRGTAVLRSRATTAPTPRNCHLQCIAETGTMSWQKASGYNERAKVEAAIGRWKQVVDNAPYSRRDEYPAAEVDMGVHILKRMLELGRPSCVRTF
jgi:hypothetical protein